jgi:hypothetical protein
MFPLRVFLSCYGSFLLDVSSTPIFSNTRSDVGGSPPGSHGLVSERLTDVESSQLASTTVEAHDRRSAPVSSGSTGARSGGTPSKADWQTSSAVNVQNKGARVRLVLNVLRVVYWGATTLRAMRNFVRWHRFGGINCDVRSRSGGHEQHIATSDSTWMFLYFSCLCLLFYILLPVSLVDTRRLRH